MHMRTLHSSVHDAVLIRHENLAGNAGSLHPVVSARTTARGYEMVIRFP